ncbi:hypothetical protein [Actinokineospora globicatena]|uniref:Uncharacterized protein n=1 Tax=Actinokineospora globicatena TaxID=103729 RepID=A0A9W6QNB5_9PSEU|nr:hypothetical protein [Actinokineospora globicatena]GLW91780.1 hypothetical protein Aglo03_25960 [Actinokineospora globicatena]
MNMLTELGPVLMALGGLGGLAAVLVVPGQLRKLRSESRLSDADAVAKVGQLSVAMLEPARQELAKVSSDLRAAHAELDTLRERIKLLMQQVDSQQQEITRLRAAG